jgi:voltage-gated potassium channel
MYYKIKKIIYDAIVDRTSKSLLNKGFHIFQFFLIILYIILIAVASLDGPQQRYHRFFFSFELFIIIVFTIEFILRIWSCNIDKSFRGRFGRLRYLSSPLMIIDFLAIFPFYLVLVTPIDLEYLGIGRLFRVFDIFRYDFFEKSFSLLARAIKKRGQELIITICTIFLLIFFSAFIIYSAENKAQPEVYSSIPKSMYWAFVTLTTVGYGDMTPVTSFGRFFTAIASFLGVGLIVVPASIIGSGMTEVVKETKKEKKKKIRRCPECGNIIED